MTQPPAAELRADCSRCAGLCCVAPGFTASSEFAITKAAGQACPNLRSDFRCGIHDRLRPLGFAGCTTFDCFGAGQQVVQVTFGGRTWRSHPELAQAQFGSFAVMRQLHEMRWHVTQALGLTRDRPGPGAAAVTQALDQADQALRTHADSSPDVLTAVDVDPLWASVTAALRQASQLIRGDAPPGRDRSGADLMGRHLAGVDLRRASLRGANLIGTNLAGADLRLADLAGADLRGAQLAGTDLSTSLFVTQAQLDVARGDVRTELPPALRRPAHWASPDPRPARPNRGPRPGGGR